MPDEILDDNDLSLDSSANDTLDDANGSLANGHGNDDAAGAGSSDAQGDNAELTTLDIVRDVVKGDGKDGAASPADGSEDESNSEEESGTKEDDEDYSDVPFHKHPRFQHLLRAKKAAEGDATRYRNVQQFMDQNGIDAEEASNLLIFAALLRTDPPEAWKMAQPVMQQLLQACGEVLPDDLKQKVDAGEMSAEAAAEVARSRARVKSVEDGRTFEQQQRERREKQELEKSLYTTATTWAADRRKKDPNFAAKEPLLKKEIAWLQSQEGVPNTPDGVLDQLTRAYKAVAVPVTVKKPNAAPAVGQGAQRRPSAAGGASGTAQPKPRSTLDIIRQEVGKRAG